jgi:pilus assembly protein Flp/PilA
VRERLLRLPDRATDSSLHQHRQERALPSRREVNQMLEAFVSLQNRLALLRDERGQTMAEYGVVLAVIALIVVVALTALSGAISGTLGRVTGLLS